MKANAIIIHPRDNVAVVLEDIPKGSPVVLPGGTTFPALSDIPFSHKVAIADLAEGSRIIKYGEVIGAAKEFSSKGSWIHVHNLDGEASEEK